MNVVIWYKKKWRGIKIERNVKREIVEDLNLNNNLCI